MIEAFVASLKAGVAEAFGEGAEPRERDQDPEPGAAPRTEDVDREAMRSLEGDLRRSLAGYVERVREAARQARVLGSGVVHRAAQARLALNNDGVGTSAEKYVEARLGRVGSVEPEVAVPSKSVVDFRQRVGESHSVQVVGADGSPRTEVVRRGDMVMHEVKTSVHLTGSEWARLSRQISGTIDEMRAGNIDRMYIHVAQGYPDVEALVAQVDALAQGAHVRVITDVPVGAIRAAFNKAVVEG